MKKKYVLPENPIYSYLETPVGQLLIAGDAETVRFISFPAGSQTVTPDADWDRDDNVYSDAKEQLSAYFSGGLKTFSFAFRFEGTEFQKSVWQSLLEIPFGTTTSYGAIALKLGRPKASRAVGAANGANPLPIVVPCHRVIGSNASLTGFGGGLETKQFLLNLEGARNTQNRLF